MKKTVFVGSGVAIVTPFNENGVNFSAFDKLLDFHLENNTDAIIVCGTTGESATMPDAEHLSVIEHCVKYINGRIPVIAGTGSNETPHAIKLSREAQNLGADAVLVVTPYYNKTSQRGLIKHYEAISNAIDIPMILYNVPSRTGLNITPKTLVALSEIDNIVAIKEASGNISQVAEMAALCGDKIDIYSGNDDSNIPVLSLGGKGTISVLANVAPQKTHDMIMSFLNGDVKTACKMQLEAFELISALFCEVNPIPVKTALALMGFEVGKLRMPLYEMADDTLNVLKTAMKNYGLLK